MVLFEFDFKERVYNFKGKEVKLKEKNFDLLLTVIVKNYIYKGVDKNGYTIISSNLLRKTYSRYKIYLDYLIRVGKIERDYYVVGEKSYGYRLTEFFKRDIEIANITYYPSERGNVKEKNCTIMDSIIIELQISKRLKRDFNSCLIDFDLKKNQIEKTYDEWGNYIDIGKWFRNNLNLYKWKKGYISYGFTSNRLYTNFTTLSSHVRKSNIKLNGENIVEFDIHNSFPLMVAINLKNVNPKIISDPDFEQYCTSVINGTFYNDLTKGLNSIRNCNKKGNEDDLPIRLLSKTEAKLLFQIYLNGDIGKSPYINGIRPFINEYMSRKYGSIHELIQSIKVNEKNNVYYTLVKIETRFVFSIVSKLYQQYNDIKILTCHDAIYVPLSFRDRVQKVWDDEMKEFVKNLPYEIDNDLELMDSFISIEGSEVSNDIFLKSTWSEEDFSFLEDDD